MQNAQQLLLDLPHRPALGREDFLVTSSNSAAVELVDQWPNWPSYAAIIVGPPGSGKSHLLEVWRQRSGALLCDARKLAVEVVPILLHDKTLAIEISGDFDERALFHILNFAKQENCQLLLTSENAPSLWGLKIPDLVSRLNALPLVSILPPDDELLRGVLLKQFSDRQILVDQATLNYLLLRMPRSLNAAREVVAAIDATAMIEKAEITRPFVARILASLTSPDLFEN